MKNILKSIAVILCLLTGIAQAGTVYQSTKSCGLGESWKTANLWSEVGTTSETFAQYVVPEAFRVRSPENVSSQFFDNSALYLGHTYADSAISVGGEGAILLLKGTPVTFGKIFLGNGRIDVGNGNTAFTLTSDLVADGAGRLSSSGVGTAGTSDTRHLTLNGTISGTGSFAILGSGNTQSTITIGSSNNTFSGTWNLSTDSKSRLVVTGENGLGTGSSVTLQGGSLSLQAKQTVGNVSVRYASLTDTLLDFALPNQSVLVTADTSKAILDSFTHVGITFSANSGLTVTNSRAAATFSRTGSTDWTGNWKIDNATTDLIPTIGDVVKMSSGVDLRTPGRGGDFLAETWIDTGVRLILKNNQGPAYLPNLILNGGTVFNGLNGYTLILDGNILMKDGTSNTLNLDNSTSDARTTEIRSDMTGGGDWIFDGGTGGIKTVILKGDNSGYSGTITLANNTNLETSANSALGTGTLVLQGTSDASIDGVQSISSLRFEGTSNQLTIDGALRVPTVTRTAGAGMPTITLGSVADFAFTNLGDADNPINLTQTAGSVALLGTQNVLSGDYIQTGGDLQMNLGTQTLSVGGNLKLTKLVLDTEDGFTFDPDRLYPLLYLSEDNSYDFDSLEFDLAGALVGQDILLRVAGDTFYAGSTGAIESGLPEPGSWVLLLTGCLALGWRLRKRA